MLLASSKSRGFIEGLYHRASYIPPVQPGSPAENLMRMDVRQGDETNEQLQKAVLLMPKSWPPIRKYLLPTCSYTESRIPLFSTYLMFDQLLLLYPFIHSQHKHLSLEKEECLSNSTTIMVNLLL